MCKPPNAATRSVLEVHAVVVEQLVILLQITCELAKITGYIRRTCSLLTLATAAGPLA